MSRSKIGLVIVSYFVAAMAFGAFETIQDQPSSTISADLIGQVIGAGLLVFIGGGLLPMIGWAFFRFRSSRAAAVLIAWLVIGLALAVMMHYGARHEHKTANEGIAAFVLAEVEPARFR